MPSRRQSRVNELLREEISDLMLREMNDPRIAEVTSITRVEVSADLRVARVYVSILGSAVEKEQTIEGLRAAAAFLRRALNHRVTLRAVPLLTFIQDDSIESGQRLLDLMRQADPSRRQVPGETPG